MRLFFYGNCQLQALCEAYRRHVVPLTGDSAQHADSRFPPKPGVEAEIAQADVLVVQVAPFEQRLDVTRLAPAARVIRVPVVGTAFLWPYSGTAHPDSIPRYGSYNPFPAERSDTWVVSRVAAGATPEAAVDAYAALDIARAARLERRHEMEMDVLRERERGTGFELSALIEAHFRTEQLFRTPYHACLRVARTMALTFLRILGVPDDAAAALESGMRDDYYLKSELPVHPGTAAAFGLDWAPPDRRWRLQSEAYLTFREFMLRIARCEAYPAVGDAVVGLDRPGAVARIERALRDVPESPFLARAMGIVLLRQGRPGEALPWLERAAAGLPDPEDLAPAVARARRMLARRGAGPAGGRLPRGPKG